MWVMTDHADRRIVDGGDQRERPGAGPEIVARAAAPAIPVLSVLVGVARLARPNRPWRRPLAACVLGEVLVKPDG
jgi:hypothetical protein